MFNSKFRHNHILAITLSACFLSALVGCASMGRPEGGLYDEDPPVLVSSEPAEGAVNVKKQRITMRFNENIKLDKVNEKLTISPPQSKMPRVSSNAKTLTLELSDSLKANTTYSIDFGDAVQDNNEGNPMESLSLLFSTGEQLDTLMVMGHLLNAKDLEPITGAYVGIYRVVSDTISTDSLFYTKPFERAGKTDVNGFFKILGCAPGSYRLYSLVDGNTNYFYDSNSEDIAFGSDTLLIDENYVPDSAMIVWSFNEGKVKRYLDDCTRPDSLHINVRFATPMPEKPKLAFLLPDSTRMEGDSIVVGDFNITLDTISYWLRDTSLIALDTLKLELTYLFTDTLNQDIWRTELFELEKPVVKEQPKKEKSEKKKIRKRKDKEDEAKVDSLAADTLPKITYMSMKMISANSIDIGAKPKFEMSEPLDSLRPELFHLQIKKDSTWADMPLRLEQDTLHPTRFTLYAEPHFSPGETYQVIVDSAATHNIYGHPIAACNFSFTEKKPEDYAHLRFNISGIDGPAFVELLNASDKPVQTAKVINNQAKFVHVPAGTYYARLIEDVNGNGIFDPGNLSEHRQPERVHYFAAELELRANWSFDQNWNVFETPILKQKLEKVKINKPKKTAEKKSKNEEYLRKRGKIK